LSYPGSLATGSGTTIDISSSGVSFTADKSLAVGQRLRVGIDWPAQLHGGVQLQLVVDGIVVRTADSVTALYIERQEFRTRRLVLNGFATPGVTGEKRPAPLRSRIRSDNGVPETFCRTPGPLGNSMRFGQRVIDSFGEFRRHWHIHVKLDPRMLHAARHSIDRALEGQLRCRHCDHVSWICAISIFTSISFARACWRSRLPA